MHSSGKAAPYANDCQWLSVNGTHEVMLLLLPADWIRAGDLWYKGLFMLDLLIQVETQV